jgi:glutamate--cysteine ligase
MRGADAGRADMMVAQSAFWVGLLYDNAALAAAEALLRDVTWEEAVAMRSAVPREGLAAPWRRGSLRDLAAAAVDISRDELHSRRRYSLQAIDSPRANTENCGGETNPGRTLASALP